MATTDLQRLLDDWAITWSSGDSSDPERVLALFVDDCVFEDVTFGVVMRGKEKLRSFVSRAFAAVPDFKYAVTSRFSTSQWAVIEWIMSGTHSFDFPGIPATGNRFSLVRGSTIPNWRAARSAASLTFGCGHLHETGRPAAITLGEATAIAGRVSLLGTRTHGRAHLVESMSTTEAHDTVWHADRSATN